MHFSSDAVTAAMKLWVIFAGADLYECSMQLLFITGEMHS